MLTASKWQSWSSDSGSLTPGDTAYPPASTACHTADTQHLRTDSELFLDYAASYFGISEDQVFVRLLQRRRDGLLFLNHRCLTSGSLYVV